MCFSGWSAGALSVSDEVVERILQTCAKSSDHTLSEAEIMECVRA
jgi:hypothetical protein